MFSPSDLERISQSGRRQTGVDTYRHVLTCANMCRHSQNLWDQSVPCAADADMCLQVPVGDSTLSTCDTNHIDLIWMLTYGSTWKHADICLHGSTCAHMYRDVLTCADTKQHHRQIWYQSFGPNMDADTCQHLWTCQHMLIWAYICRHVLICADM